MSLFPGHCFQLSSKLADHQAKQCAAETQQVCALSAATRIALIHQSNSPTSMEHNRLNEVYSSLSDELDETTFPKTERTYFSRICNGYHTAHRRQLNLIEVFDNCVCRLNGEEVEWAEYAWMLIRHSWLNYTTETLATPWTNSSAFYAQL